MAISPDPDEWTDNAWKDRSFEDYELEPYEKRSLQAISDNIKAKAYTDKEDCREHLELLEDLANKIQDVIQNERSIGKENWDVDDAYKTIRSLQRALSELCKQL